MRSLLYIPISNKDEAAFYFISDQNCLYILHIHSFNNGSHKNCFRNSIPSYNWNHCSCIRLHGIPEVFIIVKWGWQAYRRIMS